MSILEKLSDERIFYLELTNNNTLVKITENCDSYFTATLSKDELSSLIEELKDIRDKMLDVEQPQE